MILWLIIINACVYLHITEYPALFLLLRITDWVIYLWWVCTGSLFFFIIIFYFFVPILLCVPGIIPLSCPSLWQRSCLQRKTKWTLAPALFKIAFHLVPFFVFPLPWMYFFLSFDINVCKRGVLIILHSVLLCVSLIIMGKASHDCLVFVTRAGRCIGR